MTKNNQKADRAGNKKAGNAPKETPEQKRQALAKQLGLKPKTVEMIELMENDKKLSQTEAYIRIHGTDNRESARSSASALLAKPNVQIYKDSAIRKAKRRVVSLVSSDNEGIALKASQDIIDRTEGKAQPKEGTVSRVVRVEVDLTGVKLGNHYLPKSVIDVIDT